MTDAPLVVVLGVGNTLMQDDGVGVWAVRAVAQAYELPSHVRLVDGGVAGLRCLPEIEAAEHLLIIDAVEGEGLPGTIYRLRSEDLPGGRGPFMSAHEVGITEVLAVARLLEKLPHTRILGVQPLEARAVGLDLTPPLQDALPRVVAAIVDELQALGVEVREKKDINHADLKLTSEVAEHDA
ncbi:MAG TPA: HyaD/HybD family hydrogenase maturation endopeptidase [Nitrospiria bacterium]|nr:HyaD/HybD family hydrogenase maturation endopeptidase [Nitrospiria bacterium]